MSSELDIVREFRLETTLAGGVTRHIFPNVGTSTPPDEVWKRTKLLSRRPEGLVWTETCIEGSKQGESRAVKSIVKRVGSQQIKFGQELEALSLFSQSRKKDSFVEYYGWFEDNDMIYLTMEHLELGDLSRFLCRPFSEGETRHLLSQVLHGVVFMHSRNFSHRDLKPQNILVKQSHPVWIVKIADFGISKRITDTTDLRTVVGTRQYMAPEVMGIFTLEDLRTSPPKDGRYSLVVDVWSLGVIAFQLLTSSLPFPNVRDLSSFVTLGMAGPTASLLPFKLSQPCTDFVTSSLDPSPLSRPTTRELEAHAWLRTACDAGQNVTPSTVALSEPIPIPTDIEQQLLLFDITDPSGEWDTIRPPPVAKTLKPAQFSPGGTTATSERLSIITGSSAESKTLNTTIGDEEFDFDDLVVNSAAYRKAFAKQMKLMKNDAENPQLSKIKSQEIVKKRSFRNLFRWRQIRQDTLDENIFDEPSPVRLRGRRIAVDEAAVAAPRSYELLPGGRITRMSAIEKPQVETESSNPIKLDPASARGDAKGPNPIFPLTAAQTEPEVLVQSEQLSFFKDYYSQDAIHPGDRVAVLWAYKPRAINELNLDRGDMIKVVGIWENGWAMGVMVDERVEEWEARQQAQRDSGASDTPGGNRHTWTPVNGEAKEFPLVCVCLPEHWRKTIEGQD